MHPLYTRHFPSNCRYIGEENWHSHPSGVRQKTSGNIYKAVCRKQSRSRTLRRIWVGLNGMTKERLPEEVTSEQSFSWIKWESQAGICGEQLLDTANHTVPCLCWQRSHKAHGKAKMNKQTKNNTAGWSCSQSPKGKKKNCPTIFGETLAEDLKEISSGM